MDLSFLNRQQQEAIYQSIDHNVVLLAAAGSGKTKTLVSRIQYLIEDKHVSPDNIMAITFTNKAAKEIVDRIAAANVFCGKMWVGTFHRNCIRLLRQFGDLMGIRNFTILDSENQKKMIREILSLMGAEVSQHIVHEMIVRISSCKNDMISPSQSLLDCTDMIFNGVYQEYQNRCWNKKTFDFDDLILYTIYLLQHYPTVANWVYENIRYIMVDETQDTNSSQYQLVNLLCGTNNIFLVGDTNQSIYGFRKARPEYLENFSKQHPNTVLLKLEQNYRSTQNIIHAANAVISRNLFGTKVEMFTNNEAGDKIYIHNAHDPRTQAGYVMKEVHYMMQSRGFTYNDFAIIYRTNAQSRIIEEEFTKNAVPYTIFGSTSFYNRKEVKDLLSYLKLYINHEDEYCFRRVLSTIKGVGKTTIEKLVEGTDYLVSLEHGIQNDLIPTAKALKRLKVVFDLYSKTYTKCSDFIADVLSFTEYRSDLQLSSSPEDLDKLSIIDEFLQMLLSAEDTNPNASMSDIIDQISLLSETKGAEKEKLEAIKMMTGHASKGLEFKIVFIIGCEEGLFPHGNSLGNKESIEEERRLFYVAMTRAQKILYLIRSINEEGSSIPTRWSRFVTEIPDNYLQEIF